MCLRRESRLCAESLLWKMVSDKTLSLSYSRCCTLDCQAASRSLCWPNHIPSGETKEGKKNPLKQSETLSHCSSLGMCRETAKKKRALNNLEPDQGGEHQPGGIILSAPAIVGFRPLWLQQHNPLMTETPFRCSRLVFPHLPGREGCDKPDRGPPGWRGSAGGTEPMGVDHNT